MDVAEVLDQVVGLLDRLFLNKTIIFGCLDEQKINNTMLLALSFTAYMGRGKESKLRRSIILSRRRAIADPKCLEFKLKTLLVFVESNACIC